MCSHNFFGFFVSLVIPFLAIKQATAQMPLAKISFFPQVHYVAELEAMDPSEREPLKKKILESQFFIYHTLLSKLKAKPNLPVFSESFYYTKFELYRFLSKEENRLRKRYRMPPVQHHELNIDPAVVTKELSSQMPEHSCYKIDWHANNFLSEGLIHLNIPKSYVSKISDTLPIDLEDLNSVQKEALIKYGAGELLTMQGWVQHPKATSELGKKSGYRFLKRIDSYGKLPMAKRGALRESIFSMYKGFNRMEPDFYEEINRFLAAHPYENGDLFSWIGKIGFCHAEAEKELDDSECTHCAELNSNCELVEDELLAVMRWYHVYLTREREVVQLIKSHISKTKDDEIVLIYGAAHDFESYFAESSLGFDSYINEKP